MSELSNNEIRNNESQERFYVQWDIASVVKDGQTVTVVFPKMRYSLAQNDTQAIQKDFIE
jgi:hypothetical protein